MLVYLGWGILLFRPDWWLESLGIGGLARVSLLCTGAVALVLVFKPSQRDLHWPLLYFLVFTGGTLPFSYNIAYTRDVLNQMVVYSVLALGAISLLRSVHDAKPLIVMVCLAQFGWFQLFGALSGQVRWHGALANYDGYGPFMAMGIGLSSYFGMATANRRVRLLAFGIAGLCFAGVVASFARGAVLTAVVVIGWVWLRSPYKGRTSAAIVVGLIVTLITAQILSDQARGGNRNSPQGFWAEMSTLADGAEVGTVSDRVELVRAAWAVVKDRPLIGAGAGSFGVAAATILRPGDIGGDSGVNPRRLYDRALHNTHLQVLSEQGVLGACLYVWLFVDFWRRNRALRSEPYRQAWSGMAGSTLDLRFLSFALETGMVGFVTGGLFYNQLYFVPWLWSLLTANATLHAIITRSFAAVPLEPRALATVPLERWWVRP